MAAPLGFKDFTTGEVLTAADVDGYLMQGIWVFANSTARDAAVTSPQEGNSCYLKDTDVIQVYSGSSWVVKSGGSSPLTTKGDLYTYSTTDTRIGVGSNGQLLAANSATATGLEWQTVSSGGMTLISETTASALSSLSFSSIPSTYKELYLVWEGIYASTTATYWDFRLNNDATSNAYTYLFQAMKLGASPDYITGSSESVSSGNTTYSPFGYQNTSSTNYNEQAKGFIRIDNYASTTKYKHVTGQWNYGVTGSSAGVLNLQSIWKNTSAVTSLDVARISGSATFSNASNTSIRLYGLS